MFIPRHPVVENQFCSYAAQTGTGTAGVGGVVCYAGSVVYLDSTATNQEAVVKKYAAYNDQYVPFGFAMQKVKTGYHQVHPAGFMMPGDLGSSDVIAQPTYSNTGAVTGTKEAPLGVAHLGIWDTVHYTCAKTYDGSTSTVTTGMLPGASLYTAVDESKVTESSTVGDGTTGNAGDVATGDAVDTTGSGATVVARVVKGASTAKCAANIDNTTLYPIRIKLLI